MSRRRCFDQAAGPWRLPRLPPRPHPGPSRRVRVPMKPKAPLPIVVRHAARSRPQDRADGVTGRSTAGCRRTFALRWHCDAIALAIHLGPGPSAGSSSAFSSKPRSTIPSLRFGSIFSRITPIMAIFSSLYSVYAKTRKPDASMMRKFSVSPLATMASSRSRRFSWVRAISSLWRCNRSQGSARGAGLHRSG